MGGGGKTTTTSRDPRLTGAAADILKLGLDNQNELGNVEGASGLQQKAFGTAGSTDKETGVVTPGTGAYGAYDRAQSDAGSLREMANQQFTGSAADTGLQQALGLSNFAGNATGGRNRLSQGGYARDAVNAFSQNKANLLGQANQLESGSLNQLASIGGSQRGIAQEQADTENKKLQALGGLLHGVSGGFGQSQTTGGK